MSPIFYFPSSTSYRYRLATKHANQSVMPPITCLCVVVQNFPWFKILNQFDFYFPLSSIHYILKQRKIKIKLA